MKYLLTLIILLASLSCSNTLVKQPAKNESSYTYSIKAGSIITLNKKITIAANPGRTFFQSGNIVAEKNLNIYYPHCSITINTIQDFSYIISPTAFEIVKMIDGEEYAQGYMLFAENNLNLATGGPIISGLVSYYYLHSKDEPNVRTLECIQWDSLYENNYLSVVEIRKSLGDFFTLTLK